ncbi:MAG: Hpt domain-containing protein [Lachnospiraceae bacterium]|nr:Hpt domain-containing protein [Lachnospiraceae bacterium]
MLTIEALKEFGADTETGLSRCMGNEALYLRLAGTIASEAGFERLKAAIDANDKDTAFSEVHALKGVLGNLSLTPMYDKACEINELLRAKADADYPALMNELIELKDKYVKLCS